MPVLIVGSISLAIYLIYLLIFHWGYKSRSQILNYKKRSVSVVIAARNEEENIGRLLTSLINQSYPSQLYEIIVADDRSKDNTAQIVEEFSSRWNNVRLIQITDCPPSISPKKYALSRAIDDSKGEIVVLTDADCLVTKYWLESMVSNFRDDISMVAGFSRIRIPNWIKGSLLHKFEYFDFLLMYMAAAGAIFAGKYFSCSNQNLAYRKLAFDKVGGFDKIKHILSGDDVNLMQLFRKQSLKITFSLIKHSYVYTQPVTSLTQLISQRSRWASNAKWQLILNPEFFFYLTAVFLTHLAILILLLINWQIALLLFLVKFISEYLFVATYFPLFETEKRRLHFFPLWSILQPLYILIVAVMGLFNLFTWKR